MLFHNGYLETVAMASQFFFSRRMYEKHDEAPLSDVSVILDNTSTVEHSVPTDERDVIMWLASIQITVGAVKQGNHDHSERDTNPSIDRSVDTFLHFGKLSVLDETEHA